VAALRLLNNRPKTRLGLDNGVTLPLQLIFHDNHLWRDYGEFVNDLKLGNGKDCAKFCGVS
jgi:hypothetical protein